ncbi:hypothetical protein HLV37_07215 [Eggerthellaceae bacterium zg-1084]|uniref:Uncharacterized protein n=1 Tax=Berryella wangjianweii TaxID=2734634 RepID=A0A6M8J538_9ACTN|nr:hypothetical protein [Berryella wangjianweii]NPD31639.1 hypothetical protein [Berryella wangjianweii]NPD32866.1 hypothetical protein [Eggerthellaceae bacterium zg-997]QKF07743.1 hypothetical protein HLV38_06205 [Berryella wangjianweii]
MLEQDYLMRMLLQFFEAMRRSRELWDKNPDDPEAYAGLEDAITAATDIDGHSLLTLAPESIASVLSVSGVEPRVTRFVAHGIMLDAVYRRQAGDVATAQLREGQARAIAAQFGFDLPADPADFEALERDALRDYAGD